MEATWCGSQGSYAKETCADMTAKTPAPIANCKLCGTLATLKWSHIVPRWTYRRVLQSGGSNPRIVNVQEDTAIFGGDQYAEYMLCDRCEQRIGRWENYVAGIALQVDDTFPALDQSVFVRDVYDWRVVDLSALDTVAIVRFAVSVVWRASESATFSSVHLRSYSKAFRVFLFDDAHPLPASSRLIVKLIDTKKGGPRVDRAVVPPASTREGMYHVHHFAMFGFWFHLMVGNELPPSFDAGCLYLTKYAMVTDGAKLAQTIHKKAVSVVPKGALAKRRM